MDKTRLAVICDFDGTVTEVDVGHQVYAHFGDERWREVNQRWRRGEISSKECLIGEYSFVDASEQEVREHILTMNLDPNLSTLVKICRENNIPMAIASDGFDFYINAMLERHGLGDLQVYCNELKFNGRKVELSFPYHDSGCGACGNCKKLHVQKFKDDSRAVIYIGDGLSDRFGARASDVIFAKGELAGYLTDNDVDFIEFNDLGTITQWMEKLLAGNINMSTMGNDSATDPCQEAMPRKVAERGGNSGKRTD